MFALIIITIGLIALSMTYFQMTIGKIQRAVKTIPGPPTLPILGNAHLAGKNPSEILHNLFKWNKQYKNRFLFWVGFEANVVTSDPKDIETITTSTHILKKSNTYDLLEPWLGQGLLTSYGSHWHSHRKMITPSFHFKILVDFLGVMNKNSTKFVEKLRETSKEGTIFDIQNLISYCTLDVICDTAMGVSINAMDNNDSALVKAFQYMCHSIQMRAFSPILGNKFLFKLTPEYKNFKHALETLTNFTMEVISKRRSALQLQHEAKDFVKGDDLDIRPKQAFLDTLLTSSINGQPLSVKEIYEEVSTFMFEGHDTTASGISFTIHLLSRHPDIQEKVLEEQISIFKGDPSRQPTFNDIQEMKYLDMVLKEAQRLYPSVPIVGRMTEKPFDLNGIILPKGTFISMFIFAMGYDENSFKDPYKFDPERFNPETHMKRNPFQYIPFSAGPRNCIGQKFAMMELKSVVSKVVRTFKILPPEDGLISKDGYEPKMPRNKYDPVLSSVLTLKSDNGIHIRLQERIA